MDGMNQPKTRVMKVSAFLVAAAAAFGSLPGSAQDSKVNAAISEQTKTEEAAQASQKKVAELDDETTAIVAEYRQLLSETQSLKVYNEQLGQQVKSQEEELQTMTKQISQIETTSREVLPMMVKMLDTLDQFVKLDTPFLPEERAQRIGQLKEMMTAADVSLSEKYRRIIEAYQIETEYGRTIEQYEGKVGDKTADFLRVGRLTLAYQTLDGDETGFWDADNKQWVVDNGYRESVKQGLKIAKKQAAPDLLVVPVPAPKGAK
jgi:chromosome segregation ATPase